MRAFLDKKVWATGFALFSMFFGAGNVIFPILLGQKAGDQTLWAMMGMCMTAVLIPLAGVVAVLLFRGDATAFFERIGKVPARVLVLLIMLLIGPFGGLPRCIALSHATFSYAWNDCPLWLFSSVACVVVFFLCIKKQRITDLLGYVLTPLLLVSIGTLVMLGLFQGEAALPSVHTSGSAFNMGLLQGYQTLDLLAAFFFSAVLVEGLVAKPGEIGSAKQGIDGLFYSCFIGAFLLAAIYAGLSFVAATHVFPESVPSDQLLAHLSCLVLGRHAGLISILTVALACLTTAISLAAIFASYLQKDLLKDRWPYVPCLLATLIVTFLVSKLEFSGIVKMIAPILEICYPALIVLTLLNIAYKMRAFHPIKVPVGAAFLVGLIAYAIH